MNPVRVIVPNEHDPTQDTINEQVFKRLLLLIHSYDEVRTCMQSKVPFISTTDTIEEAFKKIRAANLECLPMVDEAKKFIGSVTYDELLNTHQALKTVYQKVIPLERHQISFIRDRLNTDPNAVYLDSLIINAAENLLRNRAHAVPVISEEQVLVGLISYNDIVNYLLHSQFDFV